MSLDGGYILARANSTARPFVCRAARLRPRWQVIARFGTYSAALAALAEMLR